MFSEEMLRTGINCIKWCSNNKKHDTCVKLIGKEEMKVQVLILFHCIDSVGSKEGFVPFTYSFYSCE